MNDLAINGASEAVLPPVPDEVLLELGRSLAKNSIRREDPRARLLLVATAKDQQFMSAGPDALSAYFDRAIELAEDEIEQAQRAPLLPAGGQRTIKPEHVAAHLLGAGFWVRDAKITMTNLYVLKGLFGKGHLIVVWGPPGSGKTFVVLEMVCSIGAGERWRGRRTRRGVVIYVVAESSRPYTENRIAALKQENPALAQADVLIVPLALDLLHSSQGDVDRVIETAAILSKHEGDVVLIAIDTLAVTFGGGDENSSADMGAYVSNIKRIIAETGAAVLCVHHCGKNEAAGMRGHTALLGAIDAELAIEGDPAGQRILRAGKVREAGDAYKDIFAFTLRPVELGIDEDGDPVTTCVVETTDEVGTRQARQKRMGAGVGKHQKAVLRALEAAGGRMPRPDLVKLLRDEGMPRNRAYEAIAALLETKMITADNGPMPSLSIP